MARLWSCGFELNSIATGVEFDSVTQTGGNPTISTTTIRSGSYSLRANPTTGTSYITHQFDAASGTKDIYLRFYYNWHTAPAVTITVCLGRDTAGNRTVFSIQHVTGTNVIRLLDGSNAVLGSSSALTADTWYSIELKYIYSSGATSIRLNGTDFVTDGANGINYSFNLVRLGATTGAQSPDTFFDDVAVNDNLGSSQASYPGEGKILHLKPRAAGDANSFAVQVGGTAGSSNNFTRVQEVTPDDSTTYNASAVLAQEDVFVCDATSSLAPDVINLVSVGVRMADLVGADATAAFKLEIKKTTGGTTTQSSNLVPNSTSFLTNATSAPKTYPLTLYTDPDSLTWNQDSLNTMQIGYTLTATNVQSIAVSTIWALIDYTPDLRINKPHNYGSYVRVNSGMSRAEQAS